MSPCIGASQRSMIKAKGIREGSASCTRSGSGLLSFQDLGSATRGRVVKVKGLRISDPMLCLESIAGLGF